MILEPLMQRYTYYPENEIIEEVVSQVMGTATVQEARQADMKKFGLLKNQVCCSQNANCCQQLWLLLSTVSLAFNCSCHSSCKLCKLWECTVGC